MCGIVGYIGEQEALPVLLSSLQRVTYRGYDSFGVAVVNGHGVGVHKTTGTVEEHIRGIPSLKGTIGVGHTRWATVGKVCQENAHPHSDCSGDIVVVHNGDVDNFQELRARLEAKGHRFSSETDSEVIAHLVESHLNGSLTQAVLKTTKELDGSYAIVVMNKSSRELVVARKSSPLVIGLGEGAMFAASDIPAILPYTNKFVFLEDGDTARLSTEGIVVWRGGKKVYRTPHLVSWGAEQLGKNGYEHYMLKEIYEQPQGIRDTIAPHLPPGSTAPQIEGVELPSDLSGVLLLGCGTSYHAALVGEQLMCQHLGIPARAVVASEYHDGANLPDGTLIIALSQSGETADTLTTLRRIGKGRYPTLAITNVPESSITREVDNVFFTRVGPEVAVAATKTLTGQLAALYLITFALAAKGNGTPSHLLRELRSLPVKVERLLGRAAEIESVARTLARHEHMFLIGRGLNTAVAMEGALKLKEIAYTHAEGCMAGELKHGPFALLGPDTPVIAIAATDQHHIRMLNTIREIKARSSSVLAICQDDDEEVGKHTDTVLRVPKADPDFQPTLNMVALQLLSYYVAIERECPIDRPRNLAKSVTVL